jgi:hypothetical protein
LVSTIPATASTIFGALLGYRYQKNTKYFKTLFLKRFLNKNTEAIQTEIVNTVKKFNIKCAYSIGILSHFKTND